MSASPFRILVIDDSAPFRRQLGGALEASGLAVFEASEGVQALWRARAEGVFDLVLVDLHMPKLDGLSFIREVRKLPGYAEIPIVVVGRRMAPESGARRATVRARPRGCSSRAICLASSTSCTPR